VLSKKRVPPDVEGKSPSSEQTELPDPCVHGNARLLGFVLIVVSAIGALLLVYVAWLCLQATWPIAGR
jgi:hypothetical protein